MYLDQTYGEMVEKYYDHQTDDTYFHYNDLYYGRQDFLHSDDHDAKYRARDNRDRKWYGKTMDEHRKD